MGEAMLGGTGVYGKTGTVPQFSMALRHRNGNLIQQKSWGFGEAGR